MSIKKVEKFETIIKPQLVSPGKNRPAKLTCSICYELFIDAITLNCSHTFCKLCIVNWRTSKNLNKKLCPMCRTIIKNYKREIIADKQIKELMEKCSVEKFEQRKNMIMERRNKYKTYRNKLRQLKIKKDFISITYLMLHVAELIEIYNESDSDEASSDNDSLTATNIMNDN